MPGEWLIKLISGYPRPPYVLCCVTETHSLSCWNRQTVWSTLQHLRLRLSEPFTLMPTDKLQCQTQSGQMCFHSAVRTPDANSMDLSRQPAIRPLTAFYCTAMSSEDICMLCVLLDSANVKLTAAGERQINLRRVGLHFGRKLYFFMVRYL